jgi:hypothetical protein
MTELCKDLELSIYKENRTEGGEQIRIVLRNEVEEISECYPINQNEKPHRSQSYYVIEATILCLRRLVSEGFLTGLIVDSPGEFQTTKIDTKDSSYTPLSTEWDL